MIGGFHWSLISHLQYHIHQEEELDEDVEVGKKRLVEAEVEETEETGKSS